MSLTLLGAYVVMGITQFSVSHHIGKKNRKLLEQQTASREQLEEEIKRKDFKRAREEMVALHRLQLQIEEEAWKDRLDSIDIQFHNNRLSQAYAESIKNWPLLVPPFIMRGATFNVDGRKNMPPQLIIGPSLNQFYDHEIMPVVEEKLSLRIAKNWNETSLHQIIYYANSWKSNLRDLRTELKNLKSQLQYLPILAIQPFIDETGNISFSYSHWGFFDNTENGDSPSFNCIYNPKKCVMFSSKNGKMSINDINLLSERIASYLELFVGYASDLYYWNHESVAPQLPSLVRSGQFKEAALYEDEVKNNYLEMRNDAIKDNMLCYHPDLSLKMLTAVEGNENENYERHVSAMWDEFVTLRSNDNVNKDEINKYEPSLYTLGPNDFSFLTELKSTGVPGTEPSFIEPLLITAQEDYFHLTHSPETIFGI